MSDLFHNKTLSKLKTDIFLYGDPVRSTCCQRHHLPSNQYTPLWDSAINFKDAMVCFQAHSSDRSKSINVWSKGKQFPNGHLWVLIFILLFMLFTVEVYKFCTSFMLLLKRGMCSFRLRHCTFRCHKEVSLVAK